MGRRRQLLRVPVRPRRAGRQEDAQPAVHDAPRRRRGSSPHRCEGRRRRRRVHRDGRWLAYRTGKEGEEQLFRLSGTQPDAAAAEPITRHPTGVRSWAWSPDGTRIYFVTPDRIDPDEKLRREKKFTVNIRNPETPVASLWVVNVSATPSPDGNAHTTKRLTEGGAYSVDDVTISKDGKWVGFRGLAANRYQRGITSENIYSDLYLLEVATGTIERLTSNAEIGESNLSFSPDSQSVAFSGPDDLVTYGMSNSRVYVRVDRAIAASRSASSATTFDGDVTVGFWAKDASTIYFNEGIRATSQVVALDVKFNTVRPITEERASVSAQQDADTGVVLIDYADGTTPPTLFTVDTIANASTRTSWRQLTDPNPQVRRFALGQQEEITWKSKDGTTVGGVLVKPVGYRAGPALPADRRHPRRPGLGRHPVVQRRLRLAGVRRRRLRRAAPELPRLHQLRQQARRPTSSATTWRRGIDDIMAGVDHLIAQGIADPDRMGALGWSAGGHWSNWILTHTDRFKAISTGAGTANWISMYAQSDVQRNRQFYLGNKLPYDDFDAYWSAVAAQVHQEREDADDDPRRGGRPARAEPAVDRAAHGAQAAGRADRAVHVSRQRRTASPIRAISW